MDALVIIGPIFALAVALAVLATALRVIANRGAGLPPGGLDPATGTPEAHTDPPRRQCAATLATDSPGPSTTGTLRLQDRLLTFEPTDPAGGASPAAHVLAIPVFDIVTASADGPDLILATAATTYRFTLTEPASEWLADLRR